MATLDNNTNEAALTDEAYDLLDCFTGGLETVVCELAEGFAVSRTSAADKTATSIRIQAEDVRQAGEVVIKHLRQLIDSGAARSGLRPVLDRAAECFNSRS